MNDIAVIVCKPTKWFFLRAAGMFAMFAFLAGWFYKDASVGYRKGNEVYQMEKAFGTAALEFLEQSKPGTLTAEQWRQYAGTQSVDFGGHPVTSTERVTWPEELQDAKLLAKGPADAWDAYTERMKLNRKAPEKIHDQRSITEQWCYFFVLTALALFTLFVLVRTSRRKISVDHEKITTQSGKVVRFHELKQLDLRKWQTKGLASGKYVTGQGDKGSIRFDGLTYGGFKKEEGEPAEALMNRVREHFKGELIEYVSANSGDEEQAAAGHSAAESRDSPP